MAKAKRKSESVQPNAAAVTGYTRPERFAWVHYWPETQELDARTDELVADALTRSTLDEVQEALVRVLPPGTPLPLLAKIRTNLTFGELEAIPFALNTRWNDIWPAIVPYILEWNFTTVNDETGELERIPVPSDGGLDVFRLLAADESSWLLLAIRTGYRATLESLQGKKALMTHDSSDST